VGLAGGVGSVGLAGGVGSVGLAGGVRHLGSDAGRMLGGGLSRTVPRRAWLW
jgi:hypothetical protein